MQRRFYSARVDSSEHVQLYEVAGDTIFVLNGRVRSGIRNIKNVNPAPIIRALASSDFGTSAKLTVEEIPIMPGLYFPSVARPTFQNPNVLINVELDRQIDVLRKVERDLEILIEELEECFQVASPVDKNLEVFGARFERIILLSCIGIEALFSKVLRDNSINPRGKFYTTTDFVGLGDFLRLSEYAIKYPRYPWFDPCEPYRGWNANEPGKSLPWYDAYNKLKHEKLLTSDVGSMCHALDGVSAYMVLFLAVFGDARHGVLGGIDLSYFGVVRQPKWSMLEMYFEPHDKNWKAANLVL